MAFIFYLLVCFYLYHATQRFWHQSQETETHEHLFGPSWRPWHVAQTPQQNLHMWLSHMRALIGCESLKDFLAHMHLITWSCALKFREAQAPHTCDSVSFRECWCDSEWQIGWQRTKAEAEIWKERSVNAEWSQQQLQPETLSRLHGLLIYHRVQNWWEYTDGIMQSTDGGMGNIDSKTSLCYLYAQTSLKSSSL